MSKRQQSPSRPLGLGFELYIKFEKDSPQPERVFLATSAMIRALERLDIVLLSSISKSIKSELRLHQVEGGSIKVWIARALLEVNDSNLAEGEWWKILGKFLAFTKYEIIFHLLGRHSIKTMEEISEIAKIANDRAVETGILQLPSYTPVNQEKLADALHSITSAARILSNNESIEYRAHDQAVIVPPITVLSPEEYATLSQQIVHVSEIEEVLLVRRADFLEDSPWWFMRQGEKISIRIEDKKWLTSFRSGDVDLRPGYSMRVVVREDLTSTHTGSKVIRTITNVLEVCPGSENKPLPLPDLTSQ